MDNVKNKIKIYQIINVKEIDIIPNNIEKLKTIFYNTFEPKNKQDWKFYFLDKDNDKISMENNQIYFKEQIDVILKSDNPQIYAQYTKDNYNEIFKKDELKNLKIKNDMLIKNSINENNKLKEKINDYEKKLKSYEEIVGSQMSSFEYLDNENKNNLSKINELNAQINKLLNQIKSKDYEIAKLKNGGNNDTEIQKYIQEIKKLEDNNKQINNSLNSINLELKKNKNEINNLKKEKAQLQFNLDKKEILLKKNAEKNKIFKIEIINRLREKYNKLFENTFKELNNNVEEKLQIINNLFINEYINS